MNGCLPTYEEVWGWWAPAALILLRFIQGFGLGGEYGGAFSMPYECAPEGKENLYSSWNMGAAGADSLLSTGVLLVLLVLQSVLTEEQFLSWGWCIPFFISIFLIVVGIVIRLKSAETPVFQRLRQTKTLVRFPFGRLLKTQTQRVLISAGVWALVPMLIFIVSVFLLSYILTQVGTSPTLVLLFITIISPFGFLAVLVGKLADKYGQRRVLVAALIVVGALIFPAFALIDSWVPLFIFIGIFIIMIGSFAISAPIAVFIVELYSPEVRFSGVATAYTLAAVAAHDRGVSLRHGLRAHRARTLRRGDATGTRGIRAKHPRGGRASQRVRS